MSKRNRKAGWKKMCHCFGEKRWRLPVALYAAVWLVTLCAAVVTLAVDSADRRNGTLRTTELTLADFTLVNAHAESGTLLVSENEDPQMLYAPAAGQKLQTLTMRLEYDRYPYERCLYYVTAKGEAFGQEKRVWPVENNDGSVTFSLPRGVVAVRLDPGSCTDLHVEFSDIVANEAKAAGAYFLPGSGGWFALLVLPGLAAAVLQGGADILTARKSGAGETGAQTPERGEEGAPKREKR